MGGEKAVGTLTSLRPSSCTPLQGPMSSLVLLNTSWGHRPARNSLHARCTPPDLGKAKTAKGR